MRVITREPIAHLIELVTLVQENRAGWHAVHFAFDQLLEHYRSEYQLKISINLMNDILGDRDGAIYVCDDATIFVMVRNAGKAVMDKLVFQLRYLFMDDPLAYTIDGEENPDFAASYDIETHWEEFMEVAKRRLMKHVRKSQAAQPRAVPRAAAAAAEASAAAIRTQVGAAAKPFTPEPISAVVSPKVAAEAPPRARDIRYFNANSLASIERDIRTVDLGLSMRRQPVVSVTQEGQIRTVFDEIYINIVSLRQSLGLEVDLLSNRWLFKYLTQILDDRMLETVQKNPVRYLTNPVSFNFNIMTLLSTHFAEFDAAIKPSTKVAIVVELQLGDVFTDMGGFLTAKDTVQKLGYRVCLDGVTDISFPQIDRARLGFDLIKLQWNGETSKDTGSEKNVRLMEAIRQCGANRVILTRCDNHLAVAYGHAMGVTLFQGRYLDTLVNPKATVEN